MTGDHKGPTQPLLPAWIIAILVLGAFLLLAAVITVGLWRGQLDFTGVALALISLIGGLTGGAMLRLLRNGGGDD